MVFILNFYMNLKKEIGDAQVILLINPNNKKIAEFLKNKKVGYITTEKTYENVDIKLKNVFYVDAVMATLHVPPIVQGCIFVSSPSGLTEIRLAFKSLIDERYCEAIIFDNLTVMKNKTDIGELLKFISELMIFIRSSKTKLLFLIDDASELKYDIQMFVDKIIRC